MEYTLKNFKVGDFKDKFGNTWCDAQFDEVGEPVKWVVKDPERITVGEKYFGRIEDKESKAGKPYQRFYKEDTQEHSGGYGDSPAKVESIYRCNALNNAVAHIAGNENASDKDVLEQADMFYAWLNGHKEKELSDE